MVNIVIRNMQCCFLKFFVKEFCCAKRSCPPKRGIPYLSYTKIIGVWYLPVHSPNSSKCIVLLCSHVFCRVLCFLLQVLEQVAQAALTQYNCQHSWAQDRKHNDVTRKSRLNPCHYLCNKHTTSLQSWWRIRVLLFCFHRATETMWKVASGRRRLSSSETLRSEETWRIIPVR